MANELYPESTLASENELRERPMLTNRQVPQAEWYAFDYNLPNLADYMAVVMIRASNFPVLLGIALYERQAYHETSMVEQISEFAERYVGALPRRLKAAGEMAFTPA